MPFARGARLIVENRSPKQVNLTYRVEYRSLGKLDDSFGRFHTQWRQEYPTVRDRNFTFLGTQGRGHLAGLILNMDNTVEDGQHWEGDEEIYIDGEKEPTIRGTGSEDFFNMAWGFRSGSFATHGDCVNYPRLSYYRFFLTDAIPFTASIKATIEVGHQSEVVANYSSVAFYYLFSGENDPKDTTPPSPPKGVKVEPK
jgi:hypothetical protein